MERRAVFTVSSGEAFDKLGELTHPIITEYAKKCIADCYHVKASFWYSTISPHWIKFLSMHDFLEKYDRVLYIDTDVLINVDKCPNLFEVISPDKFGAWNEGMFCDRANAMRIAFDVHKLRCSGGVYENQYFNTGVFLASKAHRDLFIWPDVVHDNFYEQTLLNARVFAWKVPVQYFGYEFNRMSVMDPILGEERHAAHMVHYAGSNAKSAVIDDMKSILEKWKNGVEPQTWILAEANGGLGDVIYAEPVLRYMIETVYKNSQNVHIYINTAFPRVFQHFKRYKNVTVFGGRVEVRAYDDLIVDNMPQFDAPKREVKVDGSTIWYDPRHQTVRRLDSHPGGSSLSLRSLVPYYSVHNLDFGMLAMIRQPMPPEAKTVELEITDDDRYELDCRAGEAIEVPPFNCLEVFKTKKAVAVHAGSGWQSKTFPADWWQAVVDGIAKRGHHPILIGKIINNDQGFVPIKANYPVIDLRDKLSFGGMLACLEACPTLLTNESAPVCAAGACENKIVLIAGPKPPELILPFRHGRTDWKAKGIYGKLGITALDTRPNNPNNIAINRVPEPITQYLPSVQEAIDAVCG